MSSVSSRLSTIFAWKLVDSVPSKSEIVFAPTKEPAEIPMISLSWLKTGKYSTVQCLLFRWKNASKSLYDLRLVPLMVVSFFHAWTERFVVDRVKEDFSCDCPIGFEGVHCEVVTSQAPSFKPSEQPTMMSSASLPSKCQALVFVAQLVVYLL